jgi:microcystin-dependent protein
MASPYLSQITMFGGNFAPKGFALCNGQVLPITQNQALFALLGNTYGGNGTTTFALPDLRSSLPVSFGQGLGLSNYDLGQVGGTTAVTLTQSTVPQHVHSLRAANSTTNTTSSGVSGNVPGAPPAANAHLYATPPGSPPLQPQAMGAAAVSTVGSNQPHTNLMPSLCITFCIALQGVFPTRN